MHRLFIYTGRYTALVGKQCYSQQDGNKPACLLTLTGSGFSHQLQVNGCPPTSNKVDSLTQVKRQ